MFATLANADDWVEMALFADYYQDYLRKYIELKNGPPSHGTIRRVMGMISPEILQQLYGKWQERLNQNDGELLKKSFVLMRKLCDQINAKRKNRLILFRHGAKRTDIVFDRKLLKKKVMRLQRFQNCWIRFR